MVILRAACRSRITHHSSSRVKASSAPNGSSSISSCGSWISARQSEVRCCMPPDSSQGYLSPWPREPDRGQQRSRRGRHIRRAGGGFRCGAAATISSGSSRFSSVVRQGSRVGAWNAMPAILTGWLTTCARDLHRALERKLQAGRELHQGGLAAAGRADHGGELAFARSRSTARRPRARRRRRRRRGSPHRARRTRTRAAPPKCDARVSSPCGRPPAAGTRRRTRRPPSAWRS